MREGDRIYHALVVDDSEDIRTIVSRALAKEQIQADVAADGVAAENMLRVKDYDVVITDLRMPRKHGHTLVVELLARKRPPIVVVMTGVLEPRITVDLITRGVAEVVPKPLVPDVFAAMIKGRLLRGESAPEKSSESQSMAEKIASVSATLKAQLAEVTSSFQETIGDLEHQQEVLEAGFVGSVRVLTNLLDQLGKTKGSHAGRVEAVAEAVGKRMGLEREDLRHVKVAALLHDIGQFGMPDEVHTKPPWALTPEQFKAYEKYPIISAALLSEVPGTEKVVKLIEAHAENFDGTGFPAHRRGEAIPVGARIIRIADGCDTFLMHAGDQKSMEAVRDHLRSQKGKAYDPDLVDVTFAYLSRRAHTEKDEKSLIIEATELRSGQIVAENVYDADGQFLVREGAALTLNMIPRLKALLGRQKVKVKASK